MKRENEKLLKKYQRFPIYIGISDTAITCQTEEQLLKSSSYEKKAEFKVKVE
jgi:hypothetical protein